MPGKVVAGAAAAWVVGGGVAGLLGPGGFRGLRRLLGPAALLGEAPLLRQSPLLGQPLLLGLLLIRQPTQLLLLPPVLLFPGLPPRLLLRLLEGDLIHVLPLGCGLRLDLLLGVVGRLRLGLRLLLLEGGQLLFELLDPLDGGRLGRTEGGDGRGRGRGRRRPSEHEERTGTHRPQDQHCPQSQVERRLAPLLLSPVEGEPGRRLLRGETRAALVRRGSGAGGVGHGGRGRLGRDRRLGRPQRGQQAGIDGLGLGVGRGGRPRLLGDELLVARLLVLLESARLSLDVLAIEGVHKEREVERGRGEVAGEEQGVDGLPHVLHFGVAGVGVGGEGLPEDVPEGLRELGVVARGAHEPRLRDAGCEFGAIRPLAGEGLVEERSQRVDVGAGVADSPPALLGGEVAKVIGHQDPRLPDVARPLAKALHPHLALVGDEHARWGQQPVEVASTRFVAAPVGVLQGGGDLARDEQRVLHRQGEGLLPAAVEDDSEALPLHVLLGDVVALLDLADAEDLQDVGVLELGRDLGLVHEGAREVGVPRNRRLQTEDGDDSLETRSAQLGGAVFRAQARRLGFLEEDQFPELLSPGHLSFGGSRRSGI